MDKKINIELKLLNILKNIDESKVCDHILLSCIYGIDSDNLVGCDYFKISESDGNYISFLIKEKIENNKDKDLFKIDNIRTRVKPGRIVKKIFTVDYIRDNFTNTDIEIFVNKYISVLQKDIEFIHAKGDDILKYYLIDSYEEGIPNGTLGNSCMNIEEKQKFLKIYRDNKNISLIVALNRNKKVLGRALLWEDVDISNTDGSNIISNQNFMDRIYYSYEWITDKFINYAKDNKFYYKRYQTYDNSKYLIDPSGDNVEKIVTIKLENFNYKRYPYVDTMYAIDYKNGTLSNCDWVSDDIKNSYSWLRQYDTGIPHKIWSSYENGLILSANSVWVDRSKTNILLTNSVKSLKSGYWHNSECKYDEIDKYYFAPDSETFTCVVTGKEYESIKSLYSEYHKGNIHVGECVNTLDCGDVHKSEVVLSKLLNIYTTKNGSKKVKELNDDYVPNIFIDEIGANKLHKLSEILKKYNLAFTQSDDVDEFCFEF